MSAPEVQFLDRGYRLRSLLYANPSLEEDVDSDDEEHEVDWAAVHDRLRSHPHEALPDDGDAALHHIMEKAGNEQGCDPTIALVNDVVEAYPQSLVEESSLGKTPLCIAIDKNRLDIIGLLLRKMADRFPDEVFNECSHCSTPYHIANNFEQLELLVRHNPEGLCKKDSYDSIALLSHLVRFQYESKQIDLQMLRLLLDCGWENTEMWSDVDQRSRAGVLVPDFMGTTALKQAICNWATTVDSQGKVDFDDDDSELTEKHQFRVMRDVCCVAYSEKLGLQEIDYNVPLLCSLLSLLDYIDPEWCGNLVPRILAKHPEEAGAVDHNTGLTPMHILAICESDRWDISSQLTTILQYNSAKKSASVADNKGMLPLQLGATSGLEWQSLKKIVGADKKAAEAKDWKTGLFPFHLAAVKGKSFDSAYNLLRQVADLVSHRLPTLIDGPRCEVKMGSVATTTRYLKTRSTSREEAKRRRTTPSLGKNPEKHNLKLGGN